MSYQVIARKYRPQRFADVVGQEHVTTTLGNAISSGRIAHAYLFAGPRGTGKTTIARIFAKCLNATDGPAVDFSEDDERCVEIAEGRSMDVLEIDGASNRGIDQIRELRDTVQYAPATSRFKVYIIDEVHMLTKEAFNALLKTLEEPPSHVKFMFATTEPEAVLSTILSRCQRFDLRRIPSMLIVDHLADIAKKEKVKVEKAALFAIARGADGGMRDAESTLDQLISFCGDSIEEDDVLSMFGLAAHEQILSLAGAMLKHDPETTLREFNALAEGCKELRRLVGDLLSHLRNLLVYQVSEGDVSLLEITEAEQAALAEQSQLVDPAQLSRMLEALTDCERQLRDAASKKILIEVSLLKAIQAAQAMTLDDVLERLKDLRAQGSTALSAAPAKEPDKEAKMVGVATAKKMATTSTDDDVRALWPGLMEAVCQASGFMQSYFNEAHPVSLEKNVLKIGFPQEHNDARELADNPKVHQVLREKLSKLGHSDMSIAFVTSEHPADWVAPAPPEELPVPVTTTAEHGNPNAPKAPGELQLLTHDDFKNDPLIQKALETFKGQIVDVRT